jgi:hypothetical protein
MSELDDLRAKNQRLETSAELYLQLYKACAQNQGIPHTSADLHARLWTLKYIMRLRSTGAETLLKDGPLAGYEGGVVKAIAFAWAELEVLLEKCVYSDDDLIQYGALTLPPNPAN